MNPTGLRRRENGHYSLRIYCDGPKKQVKRRPEIGLRTKDDTTARLIAYAVKRALLIAGYCSSGITNPPGRPKKEVANG